jgi:hypothetical protein
MYYDLATVVTDMGCLLPAASTALLEAACSAVAWQFQRKQPARAMYSRLAAA